MWEVEYVSREAEECGDSNNKCPQEVVMGPGCVSWHPMHECAARAWLEIASCHLEGKQSTGKDMAKL